MPVALLLVLVALQEPAPAPVGETRWIDYPEADALEYAVELRVDPVGGHLEGRVDYRFRAVTELVELRLDLTDPGEDYRVEFLLDGQPLETRRQGDRLYLRLPEPVAPGQEIRFQARLEGRPPDGFYFFRTRYGEPCAFTDHFSVRARGWLPCEDHPADRARFRLRVAAPGSLEIACTGGMEEVREAAWVPPGWRGVEASSRMELPTYLLAVAVAPFARLEEEGDPRLVPHFVYRRDLPKARQALVHHAAWMRLMEARVGPYPFAKYCVVQIPTRWGGMENAGNTFIMERLLDRQRHGVGTLAHEFVHQWFGDGVGYARWRDVWLSEGFASYFGPWLDAATGGPPLARAMESLRRSWLRSQEGRSLPVLWGDYPKPDAVLNRNAYPKGAWVLHMLRVELGDEVFFAAMQRFYQENRGRSVTTAALRRACEAEAGRDLGPFFRQWLERPDCPRLRFTWAADRVVVEQVQEGEPFDFLLPLAWTGTDGTRHKRYFRVREREEEFALEGGPIRVPVVDPDVELLYRP